jgi:predicted alpha/beta-fold hydrolase
MTPLVKRGVLAASVIGVLAAWALTIEGYFVRQKIYIDPQRAARIAAQTNALWEDVTINASDGVPLRAWFFDLERDNGRAVLLVHGGGLSRLHMLTRASWLLKEGYSSLAIDLRGCGSSGGSITWGVHEPNDAVRWAKWLRDRTHAAKVFGYGTSRGSTTLIQSR